MKKTISVSFPLNLSNQNKFMYEPYLSYELMPQKIKFFKNVFVTFSGFCLNNQGLIKACHHDYPSQQSDYMNEAAKYYYDVTDHPENLLLLDDDNTYLAIHHPWFNYFHWITESIFRLWMVRHSLDKYILLLPEYYKNADFITSSLKPFQLKNIYFIPNGKSLMVKNLCLPQIKQVCDSYNCTHLKQVRRFYTNYLSGEQSSINLGDKIYVSRNMAKRRKVVNEDKILSVLDKYGFTIFHPEKFSFLQQLAVFSRVRYLVGEHGSGLTNLLFVPEGASLLELHKDKTNELDHPSPLFWYMAEGLDIKYYHQLCKTYGADDYFDGDYIVDAALLEENVRLMLNQ